MDRSRNRLTDLAAIQAPTLVIGFGDDRLTRRPRRASKSPQPSPGAPIRTNRPSAVTSATSSDPEGVQRSADRVPPRPALAAAAMTGRHLPMPPRATVRTRGEHTTSDDHMTADHPRPRRTPPDNTPRIRRCPAGRESCRDHGPIRCGLPCAGCTATAEPGARDTPHSSATAPHSAPSTPHSSFNDVPRLVETILACLPDHVETVFLIGLPALTAPAIVQHEVAALHGPLVIARQRNHDHASLAALTLTAPRQARRMAVDGDCLHFAVPGHAPLLEDVLTQCGIGTVSDIDTTNSTREDTPPDHRTVRCVDRLVHHREIDLTSSVHSPRQQIPSNTRRCRSRACSVQAAVTASP